jgi:hypothetical protein
MHRIISATPLEGYRISVRFADGLEGEVDLSDLVGQGVFEAWRDPAEFEKVFVDKESGTVAWPRGIDLCPDALRKEIVERQKAA